MPDSNKIKTSRRAFLGSGAAALMAATAGASVANAAPFHGNCSQGKLPRVVVHKDGHFLAGEDGAPFFWLGDTAWQLIHSTTRDECSYYLQTRSRQCFTVIQTVVLAEFNGITQPTATGLLPFAGGDPQHPNDAFFDRVVEIVDEAAVLGLYVALVPGATS